jgi:hypothetical protein
MGLPNMWQEAYHVIVTVSGSADSVSQLSKQMQRDFNNIHNTNRFLHYFICNSLLSNTYMLLFLFRNHYLNPETLKHELRYSLTGTATGYEPEGRGNILLYFTFSKPAVGPIKPLSPGLKRPGQVADQSTPTTAQVMIGGAIPSLSYNSSWHYDYLIKQRDNLTFAERHTRTHRCVYI